MAATLNSRQPSKRNLTTVVFMIAFFFSCLVHQLSEYRFTIARRILLNIVNSRKANTTNERVPDSIKKLLVS